MKRLTVGSTFTGVGGADLGFEWAGFDIKWQCESDAWKQTVLRAHWPSVELFDDICTMKDPPPVDVMIGGFPCQDLSVAGRRKGFSGERSVLAFEFLRVAESLQPRWIVLENVPGLLSSNGGRDFARLIDEVVGCGYGVAWRILDARYFGVPQRRRRVFIVARRADAQHDPRSASRLALRALFESGSGDTSEGWQAWTETTRSVAGGPGSGSVVCEPDPAGPLTRRYAKGVNTTMDDGAMIATLAKRDDLTNGGGQRECAAFRKSRRAKTVSDHETWVDADHANTLNAFDVGDTRTTHAIVNALDRQAGGPDDNSAQAGHLIPFDTNFSNQATPGGDISATLDTRGKQGVAQAAGFSSGQSADARSIGYEEGLSPTLRAGEGGNSIPKMHQHMTVRRLTPVECERLMGWSDGFTAPEGVKASDSKRYAACGDGIVAPVAFWIADRIRMIEEEETS